MKKIITVLLTVLFLTNCGYTPIYSNKNFNFNIKDITTSTNNLLNSRTKKKLLNFSNQESSKVISLNLDVQKKTNILAKDSRGDATRYETVISMQIEITYNQGQKISNFFEETFNYIVNKNKFELSQYEKEIENSLIEENINRITIYLSKL